MASTTLTLPAEQASAPALTMPPRVGAVLALDLGTTMGWAVRMADGAIHSGAVSFHPSRYDGGGMRYLRFRSWLDGFAADAGGPGAVYFEEVRRHVGTDAAHLYGGFLATLTAWCEQRGVAYEGVPVGTIKRHITGRGNADKAAVYGGDPRSGLCARRRQRGRRHRHPALGDRDPGVRSDRGASGAA